MRRRNILGRQRVFIIGTDGVGGQISIPYETRGAHLHTIGMTGVGKSRMLADYITQDIANQQGVTVFDPHSELYDLVVRWLADRPLLLGKRKVHLVDFSDENTVFSFNPLKVNHPDEAYSVADVLTEGLSKVFGNPKATETPLIDATLNTIFVLLAQHQLPVAAAHVFLHERHADIRAKLAEGTPNDYYRELGLSLASLKGKAFSDVMDSSERRLRKIIGNPMMRRVFSQTTNTIDFRSVMDNRDVLLFNLRPRDKRLSDEGMRAVGTILLNTMFADARSREPDAKPEPHMLYIDEVQNYVNDDIEGILNAARKHGLFLTLSHQTLDQLRQAGDKIYSAVMTCTKLKAIFSVPHAEALEFVDDLFSNQIDPEKLKENVRSPHTVSHSIHGLRNESEGGGNSTSTTNGHAHGLSFSRSESEMEAETEMSAHVDGAGGMSAAGYGASTGATGTFNALDNEQMMYGVIEADNSSDMSGTNFMSADMTGNASTRARTTARGTSNSHSISTSSGATTSHSWLSGVSEAAIADIEWLATQTFSIDDQRYDWARAISRSSPRQGFFAIASHSTISFRTRDMPDLHKRPKAEAKLLQQSIETSGSIKLVEHSDPDPLAQNSPKVIEDEEEMEPVFTYRVEVPEDD